MGKLDGKVALITGAASGIGRATALLFAREGAKVAAADLMAAPGQETARLIEADGGQCVFVQADVSIVAHVASMVNEVARKYGRIDVLHNNASIQGPFGAVTQTAEEDWDKVIANNLKSVFLVSKHVIPIMAEQGGGTIVNMSSLAGVLGVPEVPAYAAAKGGIIALTRSMALAHYDQKIRVNCVCPGGVITGMTEPWLPSEATAREAVLKTWNGVGKRGIQPEEIARAVLFLACDDSSVSVGPLLTLDLGYSVA